jgi:energy-coupling factor transporter transmembrane protein EcfT
MILNKQTIKPILLVFYILILIFTNISFVGFWTDILGAILLLILFLWKGDYKSLMYMLTSGMISFLILFLYEPFILEKFNVNVFRFQEVNGRLFNAYFRPVGSYSGGYGNFWITESPKYFPFIEKEIYYDRTVYYDFNSDTFDGQPVNASEVVKSYIQGEIIDKNK